VARASKVADYYSSLEERTIEDAEISAAYHQLIHLAKEKLPPQCREVFMLCYIERLPTHEIAKRMGITEKTVANLKLYAYKKLKKEIDPSSGSPLLAVLLLILLDRGFYGIVSPASLIFYGLALVSASNFTFADVKYLGLTEIVLGLVAACLPGYGLLFWAIGFGVLHIVYGGVMYYKYDR